MNLRPTIRRTAGACMALALAAATVAPVEARLGSSRNASPSRSYSAPSRPPVYTPPPSNQAYRSSPAGRVGGGSSIGMQRSDVTARARADRASPGGLGAPAAGAGAGAAAGAQALPRGGYGTTPPGYGAPPAGYGVPPAGYGAQAGPQNRGGSWVGPAIAGAAVGAAAGYALGNRNEQSASTAAPGAQPAPADAGGSDAAPSSGASGAFPADAGQSSGASGAFPADAAAPARSSGTGLGGLGSLALLALLAALGLVMYRKMAASRAAGGSASRGSASLRTGWSSQGGTGSGMSAAGGIAAGSAAAGDAGIGADPDAQSLMAIARPFFAQLQELNNRGDLAELRARTTDDLYPALAADIQGRTQPSRTTVTSVDAHLLDLTREANRTVASVRFSALVGEGPEAAPEPVDEVWHFVREATPSASWKLAGIEQV